MRSVGQVIMIQLLFLFMTIAVMVAMIPALNAMLNIAQQSDGLNCVGYRYNGDVNNTLSYNASIATNTLACVAIRLYLPYIILIVLIGGASKLLMDRVGAPQPAPYYP